MDDLEGLLDDPLSALDHAQESMRRLAVATLGGAIEHLDAVAARLDDGAPIVRAAAAEALGAMGAPGLAPLLARIGVEDDEAVIEALAAACGEVADPVAVPWLMQVAAGDHDTLTRETAVASLGAIGDGRSLPLLLDLVANGPPQVRRRTVVALTVFDGAEVEAAIRRAAVDRNPMVREAALMVVGMPIEDDPAQ